MPSITAAFEKPKDGRTLYVSIPSSTHGGEYLIGISLRSNKVIITHDCPRVKFKRPCKHLSIAYEAFKEWLWWMDLRDKELVIERRAVRLSPDWIRIPVPGTPPDFGEGEKEYVHSA